MDWPLLQKYIWPTSFKIWMMGPKMWSAPNKIEVLFHVCFINVLPSHMVEAIEPPQPPFDPPCTQITSKSRWLKPEQVDYWEGALQCLIINFVLKWLTTDPKYMGLRSFQTWALGLKMCYAPTKSWMLYNLCFVTFLPSLMLEAADPPWALT